ncbi:MAG: MATE family efflux transporter, partial [Lachnospiraceae bacterium]|nr:MATE family efflux transporter [Lachnospiraceae bacterium]
MSAVAVQKNDFGQGSMARNIMSMAVPMTVAQLLNILYNLVDRMYLGRIPGASSLALTGVGLTFPIVTMINAFSGLFGMGGAPLCSIARGEKNMDRAEKIMQNSFWMLSFSGIALTIVFLLFQKPLLYTFGASDATYPYASGYLTIYLLGSLFVMISLGMNPFINSQGFGKIGMTTVALGAIINIALDPLFIFVFKMGVQGAALATIIAQLCSCAWVLRFLTGEKALLRLRIEKPQMDWKLVKEITILGTSNFIVNFTNSLVQVTCNRQLQIYGGDLYVGVMTILNSVREVVVMPVLGITNGAQPVIGFNYGAKKYDRVKQGIKFMTVIGI